MVGPAVMVPTCRSETRPYASDIQLVEAGSLQRRSAGLRMTSSAKAVCLLSDVSIRERYVRRVDLSWLSRGARSSVWSSERSNTASSKTRSLHARHGQEAFRCWSSYVSAGVVRRSRRAAVPCRVGLSRATHATPRELLDLARIGRVRRASGRASTPPTRSAWRQSSWPQLCELVPAPCAKRPACQSLPMSTRPSRVTAHLGAISISTDSARQVSSAAAARAGANADGASGRPDQESAAGRRSRSALALDPIQRDWRCCSSIRGGDGESSSWMVVTVDNQSIPMSKASAEQGGEPSRKEGGPQVVEVGT